MNPPRQRLERRSERGAIAVFTVFVVVALLAIAGLVIDGGYTFAAKRTAHGQAEQAARIGADALSVTSLRTGAPLVDVDRARQAATEYLDRVDADGTVQVDGDTVTVTVTKRQPMSILSAVGVDSLTVKETASARSVGGVTEVEDQP